jgi:hypothetical protein
MNFLQLLLQLNIYRDQRIVLQNEFPVFQPERGALFEQATTKGQ